MMTFQNVQQMYRSRVLRGAVEEAKINPRMLCNQHCKTHLYLKHGIPYDQLTGERHDCIMTRIALMFEGHYDMIRIGNVKNATMQNLPNIIAFQERYNKRWEMAFQNWKRTGIVPLTKEVDEYIID